MCDCTNKIMIWLCPCVVIIHAFKIKIEQAIIHVCFKWKCNVGATVRRSCCSVHNGLKFVTPKQVKKAHYQPLWTPFKNCVLCLIIIFIDFIAYNNCVHTAKERATEFLFVVRAFVRFAEWVNVLLKLILYHHLLCYTNIEVFFFIFHRDVWPFKL